jgi:hypothetical protein
MREQARLSAAILSVGGFLGMGDKRVAVALDQIRVGPEARFTTRERLTSAPAFDFSKLKQRRPCRRFPRFVILRKTKTTRRKYLP